MPRSKTVDGKRVTLSLKVSEAEAKAIDGSGMTRTAWLRRSIEETLALGFRGVTVQPEVGLPDGYEMPSAALTPPKRPAPKSASAKSAPCPHRVPPGAYCKRCAAANGG